MAVKDNLGNNDTSLASYLRGNLQERFGRPFRTCAFLIRRAGGVRASGATPKKSPTPLRDSFGSTTPLGGNSSQCLGFDANGSGEPLSA